MSYILSFSANHVKSDHLLNQLIEIVRRLNNLNTLMLLIDSSIIMQPGCLWMQLHTLYFDHQCLV